MASALDPSAVEIVIGVRTPQKVKIYPLSIRDQAQVSKFMVEGYEAFQRVANPSLPEIEDETAVLAQLAQSEAEADAALFQTVITIIEENLEQILKLVTDPEEIKTDDILGLITNAQLLDIVETIYEVNYAPIVKKLKGLKEKVDSIKNLAGLNGNQNKAETAKN